MKTRKPSIVAICKFKCKGDSRSKYSDGTMVRNGRAYIYSKKAKVLYEGWIFQGLPHFRGRIIDREWQDLYEGEIYQNQR